MSRADDALLHAAMTVARGIVVALEEAHEQPELRSTLPALVGPALEQIAIAVANATGREVECPVSRASSVVGDTSEVQARTLPHAFASSAALQDAFAAWRGIETVPLVRQRVRGALEQLATRVHVSTAAVVGVTARGGCA